MRSPIPHLSTLKVAGVDEVGRGALFGPVVAAAVVLTPDAANRLVQLGVTDSKRLSPAQRESLVEPIRHSALAYAIGLSSVQEIDQLNILQASLLAMKRSVHRLSLRPDHCLVDGNQPIPHLDISQETVVKGDQSQTAIAAASILAKVWRDTLIVRLDKRYPGYDLASNKGYGSVRHRAAIAHLGQTAQHRKSFRVAKQLSLLPSAKEQADLDDLKKV